MIINDASSTNRPDIDEIWASLIGGDEPLWLRLDDAPADAASLADGGNEPYASIAPAYPSATDWDIDERPLAEIEAEYQHEDWVAAPSHRPTPTDRRRIGRASVAEVLAELQPSINAAGGLSWYQLTSAVKLVDGDEYKVGRIAEELAEAGVVIIERPRYQMAARGTMTDAEEDHYAQIARSAFAHLARRVPDWNDVARSLGNLSRRVAPELRLQLLEYYNLHQLNRTAERALFARLDALRAAYPELDPRTAEVDDAARIRWRRLSQVATIYDTICTNQLWSVARIALAYQSQRMPFDDLFQEGCLGTLRAIDTFAPERGFRFVTYASNWAKQRMWRALDENLSIISMPIHVVEQYRAGYKAATTLRREIGCLPTSREVDEAAGLKRGTWRRLQGLVNVRSLTYCLTTSNLIDKGSSVEEISRGNELLRNLDNAIKYCTKSSRDEGIVRQRLAGLTLEQVGYGYGITRERVRQITDKALIALRKRLSQYLYMDKPKQKGELVSRLDPRIREAAAQLYQDADESVRMATEDDGLLSEHANIEPGLMKVIEKYARSVQARKVLRCCLERNVSASYGQIAVALNIDPSKIRSIVIQFIDSIMTQIAMYKGYKDMEQEAEQLSYWLNVIIAR